MSLLRVINVFTERLESIFIRYCYYKQFVCYRASQTRRLPWLFYNAELVGKTSVAKNLPASARTHSRQVLSDAGCASGGLLPVINLINLCASRAQRTPLAANSSNEPEARRAAGKKASGVQRKCYLLRHLIHSLCSAHSPVGSWVHPSRGR